MAVDLVIPFIIQYRHFWLAMHTNNVIKGTQAKWTNLKRVFPSQLHHVSILWLKQSISSHFLTAGSASVDRKNSVYTVMVVVIGTKPSIHKYCWRIAFLVWQICKITLFSCRIYFQWDSYKSLWRKQRIWAVSHTCTLDSGHVIRRSNRTFTDRLLCCCCVEDSNLDCVSLIQIHVNVWMCLHRLFVQDTGLSVNQVDHNGNKWNKSVAASFRSQRHLASTSAAPETTKVNARHTPQSVRVGSSPYTSSFALQRFTHLSRSSRLTQSVCVRHHSSIHHFTLTFFRFITSVNCTLLSPIRFTIFLCALLVCWFGFGFVYIRNGKPIKFHVAGMLNSQMFNHMAIYGSTNDANNMVNGVLLFSRHQ